LSCDPESLCAAGGGGALARNRAVDLSAPARAAGAFKRIRRISSTELRDDLQIRRVQLRRLEHDNDRDDALRGEEFREEFPELQKVRPAGSRRLRMKSLKKPPISQGLSEHGRPRVGVSSWHLVDQKRIECSLR
jgi:hypothetical protein